MSDATVTLVDGAGGAASRRLVAEHVVPRLAVDPDHPDRLRAHAPGGRRLGDPR